MSTMVKIGDYDNDATRYRLEAAMTNERDVLILNRVKTGRVSGNSDIETIPITKAEFFRLVSMVRNYWIIPGSK